MWGPREWRAAGVLVVDDFLPARRARALVGHMRAAQTTRAAVYGASHAAEVDRKLRSSELCLLPDAVTRTDRERLRALLPRLRRFFGVALADLEPPSFCRYGRGGHFIPHRDSLEQDDAPELTRRRRVVMSIALNDPADPRAPYTGGELALYGAVPAGELWAQIPVPVDPVPGRLIAFRADMLHAVAPIRSGTRFAIVSRALGPKGS